MNVRLTFTPTLRSQVFNIKTIQDEIFEDDERICLRLTNFIDHESCLGSIIIGNDTEIVIAEDESKFALYVLAVCLSSYSSCVYITILY